MASANSTSGASYFATVPDQEILPIVDAAFQSNVAGLYVIGDVTGTPLVKIAANQGRQLMDGIAAKWQHPSREAADKNSILDLLIIGAGPAGISAAIEARKLGMRFVVLERDSIANTVRGFAPGKMVYSEPKSVRDVSDFDFQDDLTREQFIDRVERLIQRHRLPVKDKTEVDHIRKLANGQFEVVTKQGLSFPVRQVVVAIGRQGKPRQLDLPGVAEPSRVLYHAQAAVGLIGEDVFVVGGGNSAIEAALRLMPDNRVTLAYRGESFFRAKAENRVQLEQAQRDGKLTVLLQTKPLRLEPGSAFLWVNGQETKIANDRVVAQLGSLPTIKFLMDAGIELDGIWTKKRVAVAFLGLLAGYLWYFYAKYFVLTAEAAGTGKLLVPGWQWLSGTQLPEFACWLCQSVLPVAWLAGLAIALLNTNLHQRGKPPLVRFTHARRWLLLGVGLYWLSATVPNVATLDPDSAGSGPYYLPGMAWLFRIIPKFFSNLYGFYYLAYFSAIAGFGLYWAAKSGKARIWRLNLSIIASQWTLWWGIPTFMAVYLGRNPWTPLISRSLNTWPLNMGAFNVEPHIGPSDPAWWHTVAIVGVVWAAILTFVVTPLMTLKWGKIYYSYICSCGALAETVGNSYRHRGPKGDTPRRWERYGFIFMGLATVATLASQFGFDKPLHYYNVWVGTGLAGAVAIGFYPFFGQRVWCRMWCPLAFWMNFWGRRSKFKISAEPGK